jgi:hypothetical protein
MNDTMPYIQCNDAALLLALFSSNTYAHTEQNDIPLYLLAVQNCSSAGTNSS